MSRPAYQTRCPICMVKITVPDEWQFEKIKDPRDPEKWITVKWFCPDRMVQQHVRKAH